MVVALQPRRFRRAGPPRRFRRAWTLAGLGDASSLAASLAAAIQQVEGWYPPGSVVGGVSYPQGSLAYRNNNPGNIRPGSLAVGATGSSGGYAVFPDYQTGYSALVNLIQSPSYWGLTLTQFFQQYAPAADNNNPGAYAASVAASLGVDPNTPLSVLASGGSGASSGGAGTGDSTIAFWTGRVPTIQPFTARAVRRALRFLRPLPLRARRWPLTYRISWAGCLRLRWLLWERSCWLLLSCEGERAFMMATVYQGDEWMKARMERKKVAVDKFLRPCVNVGICCAVFRWSPRPRFASIEGVLLLFDEAEALRVSAEMAAERAAAPAVPSQPPPFPLGFDPVTKMVELTEERQELEAQLEAAQRLADDVPEPMKGYVQAMFPIFLREAKNKLAWIENLQRQLEASALPGGGVE